MSKIALKIKRKESPYYELLYKLGRLCISFNLPTIKFVHLPLYYLDQTIRRVIPRMIQVGWSIPLFKARCEKAGKNLRLPDGMPLIEGNHLKIYLGDNVTIGRSTIGASKVYDQPVLRIGNNSGIGYGTTISVSKEVVIGENCMIGANCIIMDSDDHPINPKKRFSKDPVSKEDVMPVKIGSNVWIGSYCAILKGVTIGDNTVIGAHSVVTRDAAGNCVYAGNPASSVLKDIDK